MVTFRRVSVSLNTDMNTKKKISFVNVSVLLLLILLLFEIYPPFKYRRDLSFYLFAFGCIHRPFGSVALANELLIRRLFFGNWL